MAAAEDRAAAESMFKKVAEAYKANALLLAQPRFKMFKTYIWILILISSGLWWSLAAQVL